MLDWSGLQVITGRIQRFLSEKKGMVTDFSMSMQLKDITCVA